VDVEIVHLLVFLMLEPPKEKQRSILDEIGIGDTMDKK
jgi:hypothetical protein